MEHPQHDAASLIESLASITNTTFERDPISKIKLLTAAKALIARIEEPWEKIYDIVYINPTLTSVLKVATDISVWSHLSSVPQTYTTLATATGTDPALLRRILRLLAATQVIEEVETETYRHSRFSASLADPNGLVSAIVWYFHNPIKTFERMPEFFKQRGYQQPTDQATAPWKFILGRPDYSGPWWQFVNEEDEEENRLFNTFLASLRKAQPPWPSLYPISELLAGFDETKPFLVDVGGGNGKDLTLLADHLAGTHPRAKLVLQERPAVLAAIPRDTLPAVVECVAHDFFTPNPIVGARAYFLHSILHQFHDASALVILANIRCSMTANYSKVLLFERITPARASETAPITAVMDIHMMNCYAALERTEEQWRELIEQAGLRVVRIVEMAMYWIIEAELGGGDGV